VEDCSEAIDVTAPLALGIHRKDPAIQVENADAISAALDDS
jgi:hypothetical protein